MFIQSDAYTLIQPESSIKAQKDVNRLSPEEREQTLVNIGAVALLCCMGLMAAAAAWVFLPVG